MIVQQTLKQLGQTGENSIDREVVTSSFDWLLWQKVFYKAPFSSLPDYASGKCFARETFTHKPLLLMSFTESYAEKY